ncbi:MAG: hypothetical protein DRI61_16135, partial [Chloroflexi bacterium]
MVKHNFRLDIFHHGGGAVGRAATRKGTSILGTQKEQDSVKGMFGFMQYSQKSARGLKQMEDNLKNTNKQLNVFDRILKLFGQEMYDTLRVLGVGFRKIAGVRLFAKMGSKMTGGKESGKAGAGGGGDILSAIFSKGGGGASGAAGAKGAGTAGAAGASAATGAGVVAGAAVVGGMAGGAINKG